MTLTTRIRTFTVTALLAPLLLLFPHLPAQAACAGQIRGINLVPLPTGWYDNAVEMKFPDASYVAYYQGVGLRAIRLPLYWEEMQPIFGGSLNARYLQHTREFLDIAQANGMKVLIVVAFSPAWTRAVPADPGSDPAAKASHLPPEEGGAGGSARTAGGIGALPPVSCRASRSCNI